MFGVVALSYTLCCNVKCMEVGCEDELATGRYARDWWGEGRVDPVLVGMGAGSLCGERTKSGPPCGANWLRRTGFLFLFFFFFSPCGAGGGLVCRRATNAFLFLFSVWCERGTRRPDALLRQTSTHEQYHLKNTIHWFVMREKHC